MPTHPEPPAPPATTAAPAGPLPCPACGHALQRRPRHAPERLLSWVWPQRRYRRYACPQHACGWRGLLPGGPARPAGYVPARALDAARGTAGPAAPPS